MAPVNCGAMKAMFAAVLLLASLSCPASAANDVPTPISRVVKLLQGLAMKTEMEGKMEEDLYEKFVCWGKKVVESKTASNAVAKERVDELAAYIADIEAGRIEFTNERVTLDKEIKELNEAIETATALREEENKQFLDAEEEMQKALDALGKAILVLKDATAGHETGVLLAQRAQLRETFAQQSQDAAALERAVQLGQRVLSKGDALFMRRLLTGEVPTWDWKKLNRKATYKMSYKARSFKIQDVLTHLQETVTANQNEAQAKEAKSLAEFQTLMQAKNTQLSKAEEARRRMEKENGARSMNKEEAQDEVDALTTQIQNDKQYIQETQTALDNKKREWKDRKALRAEEVAAMSKAVEILYNDDARDLATRSFKSQGYSLVQARSVQEHSAQAASTQAAAHADRAASLLRQAARAASDARLAALAGRLAILARGPFSQVIASIDSMITLLKQEENSDLQNKEQCEKDRAADTREAAVASRQMDELSESITQLQAEIEEIKQQISEKEATVAEIEKQLAEATKIRADEHKDWQATDADDKEMADTVLRAKAVLEEFYRTNRLMLMQHSQPAAGEAPPPPPSTWEAPYGGKTQQASSVVTTLELIHSDITKDIQTAKAAEDDAQARYDKLKRESEAQIQDLRDDVAQLEGTKGDKELSASQAATDRSDKRDGLEIVMKKIADATEGCVWITVNYPKRLGNRQIEVDGLQKARAILLGAEFSAGPDPNRALRPGDAFLQRKR